MFDILISGGTVYDGTGAPGRRADVGIVGERIEVIGDLTPVPRDRRPQVRPVPAARSIDATDLAVAPGFIDTHTHSEGHLLVDPQHANGLRQGITTEIMGLDGMSFAPLSAVNHLIYRRWLAGLLGDSIPGLPMDSVAAFRRHYDRKVAVNTAYLVPHGAIRLEVLGFRDAPLIGDDLRRACRLVTEALDQGAVGFSTGGAYYPSPWGDTAEFIELCRAVAAAGKVYVAEPRRAELDRAHGGDGVEEALQVGRQTGVKVHFAHHRTGAHNAGRLDQLMEPIDGAKAEGIDCSLDIYPYPTGSSIPVSSLPGWVQEGGPDAILQRLGDPAERACIARYLERDHHALEDMVFTCLPKSPGLEGMALSDIAEDRGLSPGETLCELLLEQELKVGHLRSPPQSSRLWRQVSRDSLELLGRPDYMACSDITPAGGMPHPRCYGAFPRFLGRLRRQFNVLSLEQMIQRMTDNPARRFGLTHRGRLEEGYFADVVLFDPERVIDTATYDDPKQYPVGIPYVLVNGQIAVDEELCTEVMAGQAVP